MAFSEYMNFTIWAGSIKNLILLTVSKTRIFKLPFFVQHFEIDRCWRRRRILLAELSWPGPLVPPHFPLFFDPIKPCLGSLYKEALTALKSRTFEVHRYKDYLWSLPWLVHAHLTWFPPKHLISVGYSVFAKGI